MTPPPEHRQEMMRRSDDPTAFALQVVRDDVSRRFDTLDKRLDTMVTREAHDAEVRRLDGVDAQLRRDLDDHEREAEARHERLAKDVQAADARVLEQLEADREQRAAEIAKAAADRKQDRRWMVGTMLAAVGIAVPVAAFVRDVLLT